MHSQSTYHLSKKILLGLVVFTYLIGTFQNAAFELIHAMSHQFMSDHSYHAHHNEEVTVDHEHEVLDLSKTILEEQKDSPISTKKNTKVSFDKIPQICETIPNPPSFFDQKINLITSRNLQLPPAPFLTQNSPPPQA